MRCRAVQEAAPARAVPQLAGLPEEEQDSPAGAREDLKYPAQRGGPRTFADFPADGGGARPQPHSERGGAPSTGAEDAQVTLIEEKIAVLAEEDRRVRLLMTMTGVGYFTAMLVVSEVGDVGRFRGDKEFASWMGLVRARVGVRVGLGGDWSLGR